MKLRYFGLGRFEHCPINDYGSYSDRLFDLDAGLWVVAAERADLPPAGFYRRLAGGDFLLLIFYEGKIFIHHFNGGLRSFELYPSPSVTISYSRRALWFSSVLRVEASGEVFAEYREAINPISRLIVDPLVSDRLDFLRYVYDQMSNNWSDFISLVSGWK